MILMLTDPRGNREVATKHDTSARSPRTTKAPNVDAGDGGSQQPSETAAFQLRIPRDFVRRLDALRKKKGAVPRSRNQVIAEAISFYLEAAEQPEDERR